MSRLKNLRAKPGKRDPLSSIEDNRQVLSLPTMKTLDISIAGEINLDLVLYGLPEVMPVERELLGTDFQVTLGSSSAILAHNLAVLGTHVGFVTLVGEEALGKIALDRLGGSGAALSRGSRSRD